MQISARPLAEYHTAPRQILRDYQQRALDDLRSVIRQGHKSVILVAPTGAGKTSIAAELIHLATARGRRIIFLAHRRELISQCSSRLDGLGVDHGIIQADHWRRRPHAAVHVASIQTLVNRTLAYQPDIVVVDECHRARASSYQHIFERYPAAVKIGLTATPVRSDGRGLGNLFAAMVQCPSVGELTAHGYLVPTRVFAPSNPDLAGVRKSGGDYNPGGLQRAMNRPTITGDIVAHWQRLGENRITVLFAAGIEHSLHLRDAFRDVGVAAEHLDGNTDNEERDRLLAALADGRIRVLCSVGVLTEGWDCPAVSCAILARPTASTGLYLQMAGRILRPSPGKSDALILDHAGCTLQHGFVDEDRDWSLDIDRPGGERVAINTSIPVVCPECFMVYRIRPRACECGYVFSMSDRSMPRTVDGDLVEISAARNRYSRIPDHARRTLYLRWVDEGVERGYKAGYAGAKFKAMFGGSPPMEWMLEASVKHRDYFSAGRREVRA